MSSPEIRMRPDDPGRRWTWNLNSRVEGYAWAALAVLIAAAWPVLTRLGVTRQSMSPSELASLRYIVAGLVLAPVLFRGRTPLTSRAWMEGAVLALCQGAPLAILIGMGLRHAPAGHASALTLGIMPAIIVVLQAALGEHVRRGAVLGTALIASGGMGFVIVDLLAGGPAATGHLLFVAAAVMGSIYVVRLRRSGFSPMQGAAFVAVLSGLGMAGLSAFSGQLSSLAHVPVPELLTQVLFQGLIVGVLSLVAFNRAIMLLGPVPSTVCLALVPGVAVAVAVPILGELPSSPEAVAILPLVLGAALMPTSGVPAWSARTWAAIRYRTPACPLFAHFRASPLRAMRRTNPRLTAGWRKP
jgi:drug/metabolite transporter (DMT)-like permease